MAGGRRGRKGWWIHFEILRDEMEGRGLARWVGWMGWPRGRTVLWFYSSCVLIWVLPNLDASDFVALSTFRKLQGSATEETTFDHICPSQELPSVNLYGKRSENVLE